VRGPRGVQYSRAVATPELVFRTWRSGDVDALVEHASNRNVWLNLKDRFPHPYTAEDAETWIGMNHLLVGPPVNFAIVVEGKAAGGIGLDLMDDVLERTASVGYWVAEPLWGRGIATAAVEFIADYAFSELPLDRLQASVFDWNAASARVLEKCGFALEGRLRRAVVKEDRVGDLLIFGRLRAG
jgi:ribosomal-protein-alanine N-acetyltransferase